MQEGARDRVVVERAVDRVGREHARKRQVAPGDALRQAQDVRGDACLLAGEHRPRPPEPGHDLVGDEEDVVAVAQLARAPQEERVVHAHAAGALHHRLEDDGRDAVLPLLQELGERPRGLLGAALALEFPAAGMARGKRGDEVAANEGRVGIAKGRDVRDRERAQRLAVVAALEVHDVVPGRLAAVGPVVAGHLERDLRGRCPVGGVEGVAEVSGGQLREALGEGHDRLVREPREHGVLEPAQLVRDGRVDRGVRVPEEVHPPGAHAVDEAVPLEVLEPCTVAARHRHQREALVALHLRARMPDRGEAAFDDVAVGQGDSVGHEAIDLRGQRTGGFGGERVEAVARHRPGPVGRQVAEGGEEGADFHRSEGALVPGGDDRGALVSSTRLTPGARSPPEPFAFQ